MKTFYSNGKLFILGEYYVLNGAKVFALPTKFGQYLYVKNSTENTIKWKSYDADKSVWYEANFTIEDVILNNQSFQNKVTNTLIDILHQANLLNPEILKTGYEVETKLTFPRNWGLGSSSTLINNIAQWFSVNAFILLKKSFGGSGYDIACAQNNTPITYQITNDLPIVDPVKYDPAFKDKLYFVYLNQKRDSKEAIANFKKKQKNLEAEIIEVSKQTDELLTISDFKSFCNLMSAYEKKLGLVLETMPIQNQFFHDFPGIVKSLGGWGGDFVLVASEQNPTKYFKNKGYNVVIAYKDMIL
jgi:mevalonate kinase